MTDSSETPTPPKPESSAGGLAHRIRGMSSGALFGSAALILVVGLLVGLAAGYKIEQGRVKNDVKNVKKEAATKSSTTTVTTGSGSTSGSTSRILRVTGTVDTTAPDLVTVTAAGGSKRKVATDSATIVVKTSPGTASDITKGSKVVVQAKPGSLTDAAEVVVLPSKAKLGTSVVSVTPTSMTIRSNGKDLAINIQGATIETVANVQASDIAVGDKVIAQARETKPNVTATEIIILPSSSAFVR